MENEKTPPASPLDVVDSPPTARKALTRSSGKHQLTRTDRPRLPLDNDKNDSKRDEILVAKEDVEGVILQNALKEVKLPTSSNVSKLVGEAVAKILLATESMNEIRVGDIKRLVSEHYKNTVETTPNERWNTQVHAYAHQGKRNSMEDRLVYLPYLNELLRLPTKEQIIFTAVYDGHGGQAAADYTEQQLHINIFRDPNFGADIKKAFTEGFVKTDKSFCEIARSWNDKSGATATVVTIVGDTLVCANVGDTSAMICQRSRDTEYSRMTLEHKAGNEDEKKRIKESGGLVVWFGGWRVNGTLAVSRSIGDENMSQQLIAEPHIYTRKIEQEDDFIVLASDGLWDVMTMEQVCDYVKEWRADHWVNSLADDNDDENDNNNDKSNNDDIELVDGNVAEALVEEAIKLSSKDNISVIVLFLKSSGKVPRKDKYQFVLNSDDMF